MKLVVQKARLEREGLVLSHVQGDENSETMVQILRKECKTHSSSSDDME